MKYLPKQQLHSCQWDFCQTHELKMARQVRLVRHFFRIENIEKKRVYGFYCEWEYGAAYAAFPANCSKCAHAMCVLVVLSPLPLAYRRRRTSDARLDVKWLISSWKTDVKYLCSRLFAYTPLSHIFNMECWLPLRCILFSSPWRGFLWRLHLNKIHCRQAIIQIRWYIFVFYVIFRISRRSCKCYRNRNELVLISSFENEDSSWESPTTFTHNSLLFITYLQVLNFAL